LKPVAAIYSQYRPTPFVEVMRYVLFIPPQLALALMIWWLRSLRLDAVLALAAEEALEPAEEAAAG
jgi:hypothetical protein